MSADATLGSRLASWAPPPRAGGTLHGGARRRADLLPHHLRLVVLVLAQHAGRPGRRTHEAASGSDVRVCNTDPAVVVLCNAWIRRSQVRMQRKSNSNQLAGRTWRSVHGVLTVRVCDTLLRAKLEGWMDRLRESWL
jgi:hypothetical protein